MSCFPQFVASWRIYPRGSLVTWWTILLLALAVVKGGAAAVAVVRLTIPPSFGKRAVVVALAVAAAVGIAVVDMELSPAVAVPDLM